MEASVEIARLVAADEERTKTKMTETTVTGQRRRANADSGATGNYFTVADIGVLRDVCISAPEQRIAIAVEVNGLFNEVIPSYREEYFQELSKLRFEMAKDESIVKSFEHFVGIRYHDDELLLEFVTTRVVILQGVIVAYRAPVNKDGKVGFEKEVAHSRCRRSTNDQIVYIQTQR